jgi:hypothetical protein
VLLNGNDNERDLAHLSHAAKNILTCSGRSSENVMSGQK